MKHINSGCKFKRDILNRVGDKWSIYIVLNLAERKYRFNELKNTIGGISQRMLTLTLRSLERDGLVNRTYYPMVPPKVEYNLTDLGSSLIDPVFVLFRWASENEEKIQMARKQHDEQKIQKVN